MSNLEIANTILSQISISTKMACGFREAVAVEQGLRVKVARGSIITVKLNGRDLYDVCHMRKKRGAWEMITLETANDVFCEDLSECVYHMVNK